MQRRRYAICGHECSAARRDALGRGRALAERAPELLARAPGRRETVERALDDHGALELRDRREYSERQVRDRVVLWPHLETLGDRLR